MKKINTSIGYNLNYTVRLMRRFSSEILIKKGLDITLDQWGVIKILEEHEGQGTSGILAESMQKDRPTLTRIVDILCRKGLTERMNDPKDRRRIVINLTRAGRSRLRKAYPIVEGIRAQLTQGVSAQEISQLQAILKKINQNCQE